MKDPNLIKRTNEKICKELNEAGFTNSGMEFSADLYESQKEFVELSLVYDPNVYHFLEDKGLIHFDFCLLCGTKITIKNRFQYTFSGRYYYLCSTCYDKEVPAHKKPNVTPKNEGCYIATMVYGSYEHPNVIILRNFRDKKLRTSMLGNLLIKYYYHISPKIVNVTKDLPVINRLFRCVLNQLIKAVR